MKLDIQANNPQEAQEYFSQKLNFTIGPTDVAKLQKEGADFVLIDLRDAESYAHEHIPGALNLPEGRWSSLAGLSKTKVNVLYCYNQQCHLAARAAFQFAHAGYPVMELEGGIQIWKENHLSLERGEEDTQKKSA